MKKRLWQKEVTQESGAGNNPLKFLAREGMKVGSRTKEDKAVNALLMGAETQAALQQLADDTVSLFVSGLNRLGVSYPASELDLSDALIVLSAGDYAQLQQKTLYSQPQANAILAQQALPIAADHLWEILFPMPDSSLLPHLAVLHIRLAKASSLHSMASCPAILLPLL